MMNVQGSFSKNDEAANILTAQPLFAGVSSDIMDTFIQRCQIKTYDKGSVIFLQDDPASHFYVIISGWVKLFRHTQDGDEAIIDMLNEGQVFGETAILEDDTHAFGATVTDDARLLCIPNVLLKSSIESDNKLALAMLSALAKVRRRQSKELESMTLQNASQRLGCFILRLCRVSDDQDITLTFPYDKSLIAARLGMKSETFSRALNKLRQETDITVKGSKVLIPEIDQLSRYACSACSNEFPCDDLRE